MYPRPNFLSEPRSHPFLSLLLFDQKSGKEGTSRRLLLLGLEFAEVLLTYEDFVLNGKNGMNVRLYK